MDIASPLSVHLLGRFRLTSDGRPLTCLAQPRLQFLFAYLLLHDALISRQQLAFAFWPDTSDEQARGNLRNLLHRLHEALPQSKHLFEMDRHTIRRLPAGGVTLDVVEFETAVEEADAARRSGERPAERRALTHALELYAADLLPDCYADWIAPLRERLSHVVRQATERLAILLEEDGDYAAAIVCARRLIQADPLDEAAYRRLMHLHGRNGDRVGVARAFTTCQSMLRRELNAAPERETQTAYRAALSEATDVAGRALPSPTDPRAAGGRVTRAAEWTGLVGRQWAITHVRGLLADQRLVTLTGAGGVGKSRLARRLAAELSESFADGAWWVDLGPVTDEALVAATVATALDVQEGARRSVADALVKRLRNQHLLLVLDNCEHLVGAVGQLTQALLRAAPHLHILATSQQPLGAEGEIIWHVPPLAVPAAWSATNPERRGFADALIVSGQNESIQLFIERARAVLPGFDLTADNVEAIIQICRRLNGIPLALELAATRVRTLSVRQIADRLDDALAMLGPAEDRATAARQRPRPLWAALEWSHGLLTRSEQILLRRLAVFAGSFTVEDAEQVCTGHGLTGDQILSALVGLEEKSLMEAEITAGGNRFRLHELVRQYARTKLEAAGEAARVEARHLDVYARLVAEATAHLTDEQQAIWLDRLEAEHDNLGAALAASCRLAGGQEAGLAMAGGLARFWATRGHFREGRYWAHALLAATRAASPTPGRLGVLWAAGNLAYYQTDYAEASRFYTEALAVGRALDDRRAVAAIMRGLGTVAHGQGDCERALICYRESLALCREIGDYQGEAAALANLGLALWQHGDGVAGRDHLEACLVLRQRLGDEVGVAYVLHLLADIAWSEGWPAEARALNERSLAMRRRLGDRWGMAYSLDSLAVMARASGDGARARRLFAESLVLFDDLGSLHGLSDVLDHLAGLLAEEGDDEGADQLMAAAAVLRETVHAALPPNMQQEHDQQLGRIRERLGPEHFRAAWLLGRALTREQAVQYALEQMA
ncbi:MAG: tetratricopeptide repeat protein [Anaerolineae bacterium]|nr:tetratricopeptide repeat protein [Anaerolineae bacterium]